MNPIRLILLFILATLSACATEPPRTRMSFGPPNTFHGMAPNGTEKVRNSDTWGATNEHYHPATPGPFKGF